MPIVYPHTSYLIMATPRSGSYLCCESLINTHLAGHPTEYFGPVQTRVLSKRLHASNYIECLAWILRKGTTPNGVFGGKVLWQFHEDLAERLREIDGCEKLSFAELLSETFPNLHYIWATRRDKVKQAISFWKASQTRAWVNINAEEWQSEAPLIADQRGIASNIWTDNPFWRSVGQEAVFDYKAIERLRRCLEQDEVEIQNYFTTLGIQPFKVVYEDLVNAYEETALQILDYLQISVPEKLVFGERKLQKQADGQSEEWLQRYYQLKQQEEAEKLRTGS